VGFTDVKGTSFPFRLWDARKTSTDYNLLKNILMKKV